MTQREFVCRALDGREVKVPVQADATADALLTALQPVFAPSVCSTPGAVPSTSSVTSAQCPPVVGMINDTPVRLSPSRRLADLTSDQVIVLREHRRMPLPEVEDLEVDEAMVDEQTAHLQGNTHDARRTGFSEAARPPDMQPMHLFNVLSSLLNICRTVQGAIDPESCTDEEEDEVADEPVDLIASVDQDALRSLKEMGFSENASARALLMNRNRLDLAMEWLFQQEGDAAVDRPLSPLPTIQQSKAGVKFQPDPQVFQQLKDMGFGEPEILAALQLAHNSFDGACEWLLGNQDVIAALEEQQQQAIDINSPVMQRMLNDAKVQASFSETRIRQALEAMVKDPACTAMWLHDPIVGPVLVHMSQLLSTMEPDEPAAEE